LHDRNRGGSILADETRLLAAPAGSPNSAPGGTRARKARRKAKRSPRKRSGALARLEADLPPSLQAFSRRMRQGLARLERTIEKGGRDARRRATRLLREASHRLGQLEARGEREWRSQSQRARLAAVRVLQQLEKAIEPRGAARRPAAGARRAKPPAPAPTSGGVGPGGGNAP
jgi:hypothetical protein